MTDQYEAAMRRIGGLALSLLACGAMLLAVLAEGPRL